MAPSPSDPPRRRPRRRAQRRHRRARVSPVAAGDARRHLGRRLAIRVQRSPAAIASAAADRADRDHDRAKIVLLRHDRGSWRRCTSAARRRHLDGRRSRPATRPEQARTPGRAVAGRTASFDRPRRGSTGSRRRPHESQPPPSQQARRQHASTTDLHRRARLRLGIDAHLAVRAGRRWHRLLRIEGDGENGATEVLVYSRYRSSFWRRSPAALGSLTVDGGQVCYSIHALQSRRHPGNGVLRSRRRGRSFSVAARAWRLGVGRERASSPARGAPGRTPSPPPAASRSTADGVQLYERCARRRGGGRAAESPLQARVRDPRGTLPRRRASRAGAHGLISRSDRHDFLAGASWHPHRCDGSAITSAPLCRMASTSPFASRRCTRGLGPHHAQALARRSASRSCGGECILRREIPFRPPGYRGPARRRGASLRPTGDVSFPGGGGAPVSIAGLATLVSRTTRFLRRSGALAYLGDRDAAGAARKISRVVAFIASPTTSRRSSSACSCVYPHGRLPPASVARVPQSSRRLLRAPPGVPRARPMARRRLKKRRPGTIRNHGQVRRLPAVRPSTTASTPRDHAAAEADRAGMGLKIPVTSVTWDCARTGRDRDGGGTSSPSCTRGTPGRDRVSLVTRRSVWRSSGASIGGLATEATPDPLARDLASRSKARTCVQSCGSRPPASPRRSSVSRSWSAAIRLSTDPGSRHDTHRAAVAVAFTPRASSR